jgi:hypothetical protein
MQRRSARRCGEEDQYHAEGQKCSRRLGRDLQQTRSIVPSRPGEFHPEPLTDPDLQMGSSRCRLTRSSGDDPPAPRALPRFITTTEQSAPIQRIGTFDLAVVAT